MTFCVDEKESPVFVIFSYSLSSVFLKMFFSMLVLQVFKGRTGTKQN